MRPCSKVSTDELKVFEETRESPRGRRNMQEQPRYFIRLSTNRSLF